jgi:hypothetical protein
MKLPAYIVQEKRSWLLFSIFHAFTVVALMISMNLGCTLHVREGEKCLVRQVRVKHTCRVAPNQYARTIENNEIRLVLHFSLDFVCILC